MKLVIFSLHPTDQIFLSKELAYLKNKFNIIFIRRGGEKYDNITIHSDNGVKSYVIDDPHVRKMNWMLHLFFSLFKPGVWKELLYLLRKNSLSFITVRKLIFYSASTAIDSQKIVDLLKENGISRKDGFLLYSYRLNTGALSIIKAKKYYKNAKCIARAHGIDLYEYRHTNNYIPFRHKILKGLDTLYCISEDGKKYVSHYQYSYCDVKISRLGTADYGIEKEGLATGPEHKMLIVSCSRISAEKRINKIVDALSLINIPIHWIHIGEGDTYEKVQKDEFELKKYAHEKLDAKPNVSFAFVGNMENREVISFYATHFVDVFVNVSSTEGIPVSIMEACSFGIPIIATNVGGTGEIVKDQYNGYLLPADFEDAELASTIVSLNNKAEANRLRRNARKEWEDHFCEKRNYETFAEDIFRLVDGMNKSERGEHDEAI